MKKSIVHFVLLVTCVIFIGCNNDIDKKACYKARDKALESCFDPLSKFTIVEQNVEIKSSSKSTYVIDHGKAEGMIDGKYGKFRYELKITINNDDTYDWDLNEMNIYSQKTNELVVSSKKGYHNIENKKETKRTTKHYQSDNTDIYAIEDALQREWNISNAMSSVGAESSNVFNVKKESSNGSEVTVSYTLRSTYNGQKNFADLHGVLSKNSDGSWKVVNLAY